MNPKIIIDGENAVLGRLGTHTVKELLRGSEVVIINSEKVLISGNKDVVVEEAKRIRKMGNCGSMKGPKLSVLADRFLKRKIRGMLPWDKPHGKNAFKRLRCFVGNGPLTAEELKNAKKLNHQRPSKTFTVAKVVERLK